MNERIVISFRGPDIDEHGYPKPRNAYVIHVFPSPESGYHEATVNAISSSAPLPQSKQFKSDLGVLGAFSQALSAVAVLPDNRGLEYYPERFETTEEES